MSNQRLKNKRGHRTLIQAIFIAYLAVTVVFPIVKMFFFIDTKSLVQIVQNKQFSTALRNSLIVTTVATGLSVAFAYTLAWCITRTTIKHKEVIAIFLTIPMLIPSISHSTGLIILFGSNGFFTTLLGTSTTIYGFWGIVLGSMMYSFPFAFLMLVDILQYEDYTPYEAANVLGIPKVYQVKDITLSYLSKPMISVIFSTFAIIFTDYGVPIVIGGKYVTLPVIMYHEVIGQLNFGKGSVIGAILLAPAIISFVIDMLTSDKGNTAYVIQPFQINRNKMRDTVSYFVCFMVCLFIVLIIMTFSVLAFTKQYPIDMQMTLANVTKTFNMNGVQYLANSLLISIVVAFLGTVIGFVIAYYTARVPSVISKLLHLTSLTSLAIPGIVLGLAYVLFFKTTIIYGTLAILIVVNIAHFMGSPYLMMYNTLGKMNENLESVGDTLGIPRIRIIIDVFLPQVSSTLLEMGAYLFINSMITISAISFLATTANKPFSLMINQFDALMIIECSAVVSLILLGINIVAKILVYVLKRRLA